MLDYYGLLIDPDFQYYGVFSYFKLNFFQDKQVSQRLQLFKEIDYIPQQNELKEDAELCDPHKFNLDNYPRHLSIHNVVELNAEQTSFKLMQCKKFQTVNLQFKQMYFYMLAVRALISQPLTIEHCVSQMSRRVYPWIAFEMCTKNKDVCLLMFNFIDHYYTEVILGVVKRTVHFAQLEKVTYGYQNDEVIITKDNKGVVYKARHQIQRAFIAEVFRYAIARDLQIKVKSHFINPNEDNFSQQLAQQQNNLKLAQQEYFKLIKHDRILPPKAILTYKGAITTTNVQPKDMNNYITVGINNVVVHTSAYLFTNIIPFMADQFFMESCDNPKCLGLHVGKQWNYVYFNSHQEVDNVRQVIQHRRMGLLLLEPQYVHYSSGVTDQQSNSYEYLELQKFKSIKLRQINKEIEATEAYLSYCYSLKSELEGDEQQMDTKMDKSLSTKHTMQQDSKYFDFTPVFSPSFQVQQQYNEIQFNNSNL